MSSSRIELSNTVTVGRKPPSKDEIGQLRDQGFRSVLDLRSASEPTPDLSPQQEAAEARRHGLEYIHYPVPLNIADKQLLDGFGEAIAQAPKPVLVHCASGKRAGMFALAHTSVEAGVPGEEMLEMAKHLGVLYGSPELRRMFARYVDQHEVRSDPFVRRREALHQEGHPIPLLPEAFQELAADEREEHRRKIEQNRDITAPSQTAPEPFAASPALPEPAPDPRPFVSPGATSPHVTPGRGRAAPPIRGEVAVASAPAADPSDIGPTPSDTRLVIRAACVSLIGTALVLIDRRFLPVIVLAAGYMAQRAIRARWRTIRPRTADFPEAGPTEAEVAALEKRIQQLGAAA